MQRPDDKRRDKEDWNWVFINIDYLKYVIKKSHQILNHINFSLRPHILMLKNKNLNHNFAKIEMIMV